MPYKFIDTHCHVHFRAYSEDMDDVVQRSLAAGVGMITVGTQSSTSKRGIELAQKYEGVWTTIGLHPNHLHAQEFVDENELDPNQSVIPTEADGSNGRVEKSLKIKTRAEHFDPEYYRELAKHPKVVAVGEFGLDYYRVPPGVDIEAMKRDQVDAVRAQLQFASEIGK